MKINLDENKTNALSKLMGVGGAGVEALKELLQSAEAELIDVRNIDPKGNMGLQSLAAQKSVEILAEIISHIFPDVVKTVTVDGKEKKTSQWR